jgi:hypothetical protein
LNKHGHRETLVAAHPGNRNAVKSGVFSPAILAPHVDAVERAIEEPPVDEVIAMVLRGEIAALSVHATAMDQALETHGIASRDGEPKNLGRLRLRTHEKLRQTLEHYRRVTADEDDIEQFPPPAAETSVAAETDGGVTQPLPATIAATHLRASISDVEPSSFQPERYLAAIVTNTTVPFRDRLRARRLLTRRKLSRSLYCICSATLMAKDEFEFRDWINQIREAGVETHEDDSWIAALVRRVVGGERLEPWLSYRRTQEAVQAVLAAAVERAQPQENGKASKRDQTQQNDPAVAPFWAVLLSPDEKVSARERLQAFEALDEMEALPKCTCSCPSKNELEENRLDSRRGMLIHLVVERSYGGALAVAHFPETSFAIRDSIDAALIAAREVAETQLPDLEP